MVGTRCRQLDNTYYDFRSEHAIIGEFRFMSDKNRTRDTKADNEAIRSVSQDKPAQLTEYRRKRDSDMWHWHRDCPDRPTSNYYTRDKKPGSLLGQLCNECHKLQK